MANEIDSLFSVVEIEVNSRCNRKCNYCPVSVLPPPKVPEFMSERLFERIINELKRVKFSGRLSYHLYNEPLLCSNLEGLVSYVSEKLPNSYQLLFTNGDFLTEARYTQLRDAGICYFLVTRHDYKDIPRREFQTILFPNDLRLSNRGGTLFKLEKALFTPCYGPSEMLIITITGDILLCFEDAHRTQLMGNILVENVEEIWFSKKFSYIRKLLQDGKRDKASLICKNCNNIDYTTPGKTWFW